MRIPCDEPTSEADKRVRQEEVRGQASTSIPQRARNMHSRLQGCVITLVNMVYDEGELVHYTFYADNEPDNVIDALKDSKWIQALKEDPKSIEVNNT